MTCYWYVFTVVRQHDGPQMHWEDVLSQATNCDQVMTHEKNAHIHTYIHTLHYITSHHITLHYITDIHTLHTYIHAHSDVWFKSYGPVAASDERGRVPTSITAVSKEKESLRPEVDSSWTQVAGVLFSLANA